MDIKKIMEVINKFVDKDGVLDQEGVQAELEEVIQGDEDSPGKDEQDKNNDLTIDEVAKMSKDEIKENTDAIRRLISELSQDEVNEHWEVVQVLLKELGA